MITEHSNIVYDCTTCGRGVYWQGGQWHHFGLPVPCAGLVIAESRIPVPLRHGLIRA